MNRRTYRRGALLAVLLAAACTPTSCNVSQIFDPSGPDAVVSSKPIGEDRPASGDSGGSQSGACPVGTWSRSICGGSATATISFSADGTGYFADTDCAIGCSRRYDFNWTASGGTATLQYTRATSCIPNTPLPSGGSQSFSCSGNTLTIGSTYTRTSTSMAPVAPTPFAGALALLGHNPDGWVLAVGGCPLETAPPQSVPLSLPMLLGSDRG